MTNSAGFVDTPHYLIYFDGAGTPDTPAGWGWVCFDESGDEMVANHGPLDKGASSNEAEYHAVLNALAWAQGLDSHHVANGDPRPQFTFKGDSKLVVNQLLGVFRVRQPVLTPLHAAAKAGLCSLALWGIEWIPRAQNARADAEAKKGKVKALRLASWAGTA